MERKILDLSALFMLAFFFVACDHSSGSDDSNNGYPSTAHVIKNAVRDIDGNVYDAVEIGNQIWMASNLKTTRFADGTPIELFDYNDYNYDYDSNFPLEPVRHYPNNNEIYVEKYGYDYNEFAALGPSPLITVAQQREHKIQGACPNGWHIPSALEWKELTSYVASKFKFMKASRTVPKALSSQWGWEYSSIKGTPGNHIETNNSTGFSALPDPTYNNDMVEFYSCSDYKFIISNTGLEQEYPINILNDFERDDLSRISWHDFHGYVRCVKN